MSNKSHIFGYLLGLLIFVVGIPALMWLVSGRPWPYVTDAVEQRIVSLILAVCGLALSIYSIIYMRIVGKGNPFDAYGHEVAPRTKHLMTSGPYRLCRNPMLVGIYIYDAGVLVWLWSFTPLHVFLAEVILLTLQIRSEEKRLTQDFGQEYLDYKKQVGRYFAITFNLDMKRLFIICALMAFPAMRMMAGVDPVYDLSGRQIVNRKSSARPNGTLDTSRNRKSSNRKLLKGFYIIRGKKVLVKPKIRNYHPIHD